MIVHCTREAYTHVSVIPTPRGLVVVAIPLKKNRVRILLLKINKYFSAGGPVLYGTYKRVTRATTVTLRLRYSFTIWVMRIVNVVVALHGTKSALEQFVPGYIAGTHEFSSLRSRFGKVVRTRSAYFV